MSRRKPATTPAELPVFTRYYELFLWAHERAEGFPRVMRPTLTARWQALLIEGLELLLELRYTRERQPLFRRTNLTFEKLRVLSRALKDRRALSLPRYEHFNRLLNDVGKQLGGWQKDNARRSASPAAAVAEAGADG